MIGRQSHACRSDVSERSPKGGYSKFDFLERVIGNVFPLPGVLQQPKHPCRKS
jgi:hypothetical protein